MTCEQVQELIHAYIDGELDLVNNLDIEGHLGGCEVCQSEYRGHLNLVAIVQGGAQYFAAPDILKKRIEKQIHKDGRKRPYSRRWLATAAAIILTVYALLLWAILYVRSQSHADEMLAQEVVSSHIRSMMLNHLVDVPSSDQHTVKPWFNGKLDFAPDVKDLADQGFPLVGGRLDYVDNRTVAALVYQRRKHSINFFIWPSTHTDQSPQQFSINGYNIVHWTKSGTTYWAVSDVNSADLGEFAKLVSR